jgi:hypothetical protein
MLQLTALDAGLQPAPGVPMSNQILSDVWLKSADGDLQNSQHQTRSAVLCLGDYTIHRRGRFWEIFDANGDLVCLTVYKRGAKEVVRRLQG